MIRRGGCLFCGKITETDSGTLTMYKISGGGGIIKLTPITTGGVVIMRNIKRITEVMKIWNCKRKHLVC